MLGAHVENPKINRYVTALTEEQSSHHLKSQLQKLKQHICVHVSVQKIPVFVTELIKRFNLYKVPGLSGSVLPGETD